MNWKERGKKWSWPNFKCYPLFCLKVWKYTTKFLIRVVDSPANILMGHIQHRDQKPYRIKQLVRFCYTRFDYAIVTNILRN
jgi:hypothetical protein